MKKVKTGDIITNVIMILICVLCLVPIILIVISSFTEETALLANGYSFFPEAWSTKAYTYVLTSGSTAIMRSYVVSIAVAVIGTASSLVITTLFAYPLSRQDLPGKKFLSFYLFLTMLFNGGLVPSYMMWTTMFHIRNTYWALILPNLLLNGFYVIMMRTYISSTIPNELIEAARIDGAKEGQILVRMIVPLSKPIMATLGFMILLGYWNDWLNGLYYVTDTKYFTIQNLLNRMLLNIQFLASSQAAQLGSFSAADIPSTGVRMSVAVLGLLPIIIAYPFFQKYLVSGIMIGGVKG